MTSGTACSNNTSRKRILTIAEIKNVYLGNVKLTELEQLKSPVSLQQSH